MSLDKIPVLDESWPLFDWEDWQTSRDALVKGTPTKYFAKEAWNAIVDGVAEALATAGLAWDDTYTTAEGAKITVAYGALTAEKFNSVRHNIDWPAPLGWAWAWNKDFRGYVGREDFQGRSTHGINCDAVYPEYIIELARKLNLLLELMRGTALINDIQVEQLSGVQIEAEALSRPAAHVEVEHISTTTASAEVRAAQGAPMDVQRKSSTQISAEARVGKVVEMSAEVKNHTLISAEGHPRLALPMEAGVLMGSKASAEVIAAQYVETGAEVLSASLAEAQVETPLSLPVEAEVKTGTACEAEMLLMEPLPMEAGVLMGSLAEAELVQQRSRPLVSRVLSATSISAEADTVKPLYLEAKHLAGTLVNCKIDTAWYPPIWVDGGLWIRQSHSVTQNENGELVIT